MFSLLYRFIVRDFVWDDNVIAANKEEITKLAQEKKKQFVSGNLNKLKCNAE